MGYGWMCDLPEERQGDWKTESFLLRRESKESFGFNVSLTTEKRWECVKVSEKLKKAGLQEGFLLHFILKFTGDKKEYWLRADKITSAIMFDEFMSDAKIVYLRIWKLKIKKPSLLIRVLRAITDKKSEEGSLLDSEAVASPALYTQEQEIEINCEQYTATGFGEQGNTFAISDGTFGDMLPSTTSNVSEHDDQDKTVPSNVSNQNATDLSIAKTSGTQVKSIKLEKLQSTLIELATSVCKSINDQPEDELDLFGNCLAAKLRSMPELDQAEMIALIDQAVNERRVQIARRLGNSTTP